METTPGLNGSSGVALNERVRALEVVTAERRDQFDRWVEQLDERLQDGTSRMDELGAASVRMETALAGLTGLPERVGKIEEALAPFSILVGMAARFRNQIYYVLTAGIGYLLVTGKVTPDQLGQFATRLFGS
jgi:hypothetical protein